MRPTDFAAQLNVSLANGWGIVRTLHEDARGQIRPRERPEQSEPETVLPTPLALIAACIVADNDVTTQPVIRLIRSR
jgi:hypothetical protein